MKAPSLFFTLALSLAAPLALAQQDPAQQADAVEQSEPDAPSDMASIEQRLDRMQSVVDRMAEANDPAARRKLMREHRHMMQETRAMMGAPAGAGGMSMMRGGMGMMGGGKGMMGINGGQSEMMPMKPMMRHLEDMQAQMDQIMQTEDPAKRSALMKQHRKQMQDAMDMMHGMQHGGGMGMMGGGMGMKGHKAQVHEGMMEAYQQMDKRLDLMQLMLEQLMEQHH